MKTTIIISVVYLEPEWRHTKHLVESSGYPFYFVNRRPAGTGSLAEAINRGFKEAKATDYELSWIVTNITFGTHVLPRLAGAMRATKMAAIHPSFPSDHAHIKNDGSGKVKSVPFVEFTAPIIRTDIFNTHMLDEEMPYWGHDLDFGVRMRESGYMVGVDHGCQIGHTYIRHNKNPNQITLQRKTNRKNTDASTRMALQKKYGQQWKDVAFPESDKQVGSFYDQVKDILK